MIQHKKMMQTHLFLQRLQYFRHNPTCIARKWTVKEICRLKSQSVHAFNAILCFSIYSKEISTTPIYGLFSRTIVSEILQNCKGPTINALSTCPVSVENSSFIMKGRLLQQSSAVTKNNRGAPGGRSWSSDSNVACRLSPVAFHKASKWGEYTIHGDVRRASRNSWNKKKLLNSAGWETWKFLELKYLVKDKYLFKENEQ